VHYSAVQPGDREGDERLPVSHTTSWSCGHNVCITCSDSAPIARVIEILPGGSARVETGGEFETINLELVDAVAGDLVLVHAGVAIAKVGEDTRNGSRGE
jgi:hydrogenase maturation factor